MCVSRLHQYLSLATAQDCFWELCCLDWALPVVLVGKNVLASSGHIETRVQSPSGKDPLEEGMAPSSSILAWRIPWTEDPGRLQSIGLQRVRHD